MKLGKINKKIKLFFWKIAKTNDSSHEIALGAAIGTFISVYPTFGFGTLIVILLNRFIKFNIIIAFATSIISNPFTSPFFIYTSYMAGNYILRSKTTFILKKWKENITETGLTILIGSFFVSGACGLIAYAITKWVVDNYRKKDIS